MSVSGFAQEQIKIKHGPYLQNLKETEVTIVWLSDKPSIGWVEIAPDDVRGEKRCVSKFGRSENI